MGRTYRQLWVTEQAGGRAASERLIVSRGLIILFCGSNKDKSLGLSELPTSPTHIRSSSEWVFPLPWRLSSADHTSYQCLLLSDS